MIAYKKSDLWVMAVLLMIVGYCLGVGCKELVRSREYPCQNQK